MKSWFFYHPDLTWNQVSRYSMSKITVLSIFEFEALNLDFWKMSDLQNCLNSELPKLSKSQVFNLAQLISHKDWVAEKIPNITFQKSNLVRIFIDRFFYVKNNFLDFCLFVEWILTLWRCFIGVAIHFVSKQYSKKFSGIFFPWFCFYSDPIYSERDRVWILL